MARLPLGRTPQVDVRDIPHADLGALDTDGRIALALDALIRLHNGVAHIDIMLYEVGTGPPYTLLLHGLDDHSEVVIASFTIAIEDDLDESARLAVQSLRLATIRARAERQRRRIQLTSPTTTVEPIGYSCGNSPPRRKGRSGST